MTQLMVQGWGQANSGRTAPFSEFCKLPRRVPLMLDPSVQSSCQVTPRAFPNGWKPSCHGSSMTVHRALRHGGIVVRLVVVVVVVVEEMVRFPSMDPSQARDAQDPLFGSRMSLRKNSSFRVASTPNGTANHLNAAQCQVPTVSGPYRV